MNSFIHAFLRTTVYITKWTQQAKNSNIVHMQKIEIFKTTIILHKVYYTLFTQGLLHVIYMPTASLRWMKLRQR
jgi:hypothetical protein